MNPKIAAALNTLSLGLAELAEAIGEAGLGSPRPDTFPPATAPVLTRPVAVPDEASPFDGYEDVPLPADSPGLGRCPTHNLTWTVREAGVSKAGKAYNAFWRCDGKDADGTYCQKRPTKAWADAHPAR